MGTIVPNLNNRRDIDKKRKDDMLKNSVPINIIIDGCEHKSGVIKSLTGIENVIIRIRQFSIGDCHVDKRVMVDMINRVYDKTIR
jgi:ERCC4-type nuclease